MNFAPQSVTDATGEFGAAGVGTDENEEAAPR